MVSSLAMQTKLVGTSTEISWPAQPLHQIFCVADRQFARLSCGPVFLKPRWHSKVFNASEINLLLMHSENMLEAGRLLQCFCQN